MTARSSWRRELDRDLLWVDRHLYQIIAAAVVIGLVMAFMDAPAASPAAAILRALGFA